ncbi:amidohydrolase family protein [Saccharopolyspora mangrovi]|uniref:Amidohydrolase family protein n=1 Tax=Saccharopolyspora mangrovi TaxID=3082379 RepID=A0ABU6AE15_9PSEU|nr:amidohydrolase family protein [Saccharopolyspora sp. S2-29]MEB3369775.1 amidohydrolase family protein [Saccharopolyspora sp. S2-29]
MTTVDSHAHVFHRGLPLTPGRRYTPDYDATWHDYLDVLDAHGVGKALLVQPSFLGTDNTYLLETLRERPDRFRGVIVVDTGHPTAAAGAAPAMHDAGVRGIRLNLVGTATTAPSGPGWDTLANRMADLGWHLEVQASGEQWDTLAPHLRRWPSPVVIDHVGLPQGQEDPQWKRVLDLATLPHVWIKLSGFYRSPAGAATTAARQIKDNAGVERLLWGSDWPWTRYERDRRYDQLLHEPATVLDTPADIERVRNHNPARLLDWH